VLKTYRAAKVKGRRRQRQLLALMLTDVTSDYGMLTHFTFLEGTGALPVTLRRGCMRGWYTERTGARTGLQFTERTS
jgi:hypothetical protein